MEPRLETIGLGLMHGCLVSKPSKFKFGIFKAKWCKNISFLLQKPSTSADFRFNNSFNGISPCYNTRGMPAYSNISNCIIILFYAADNPFIHWQNI